MSFTSLAFFPFFISYYLLSFVLPRRGWLLLAAIASSFFYAFWDWRFLSLLYYIIAISWWVGVRLHASENNAERRRYVVLSVVSSLSVLAIFKYLDFFVGSFTEMSDHLGLHLHPWFTRLALPIGISVYTFHALSYTIDLYRRKLSKPADILTLIVYLAFFPQLVAGPIVRAYRFLPQIDRGPIFNTRKIKLGLLLIAWGFFLKVCVADSLSVVIDPIFAAPGHYQSGNLLYAIIGYSFQIYGDFAGYSLIAIGLAKLQGFDFPANFLTPYFSKSFSEFWRRWHISLSSFLRDYLYIPLGGNRKGRLKEYRNLFLTMLLGGLWHGASFNFIIWGTLHGLYLVVQKMWKDACKALGIVKKAQTMPAWRRWLSTAAKMALVYALTLLAWIFFRLHSFPDAVAFIGGIGRLEALTVIFNKFQAIKGAALIAVVIAVDAIFIRRRNVVSLLKSHVPYALAVSALIVALELLGSFGGGAFIYFQF
jgi:D-alanyl-lipoteichoic acid acyltransferase DltB (MBOAT superfamily)